MQRGDHVGRYILDSLLGRGGMGEVWRATDVKLGRQVAVKLLLHHERDDVARFRREAEVAGNLKHAGIAAIYEFGEALTGPFLAMQLVEGVSLDRARLGVREAARAIRDAALAVQHAHGQGVVHRDIKPHNIMVTMEAASTATTQIGSERVPMWQIMVMDFGLAKREAGPSSLSTSGMALGTPAYMSPEQAKGLSDVDGRADIYGLGATLYALVTGRPPFNTPDIARLMADVGEKDPLGPRRLNPDVPNDLETIILKCLEKEPARRYQTALELSDDLTRFLEGDAILARPASMMYVAWKRVRKRPLTVGVVTALCLLLGVAMGLAVNRYVAALRAEARATDATRQAESAAAALKADLDRRARRALAGDALRPAVDVYTIWEAAHAPIESRDRETADGAIAAALAIDGDYGPAWLEKSRVHWAQGRLGDAEECAQRAIADPESRITGRFYLARYRLTHYADAAPAPKTIVDGRGVRLVVDPRDHESADLKRMREAAEAELAACVREMPGGAEDPRVEYASALLEFCRAETGAAKGLAAVRMERLMESRRIPRWEARWFQGYGFLAAGSYERARRALEELLAMGLTAPPIYNLTGTTIFAMAHNVKMTDDQFRLDLAKAERYLTKAAEGDPTIPEYLYNRMLVRRAMGDTRGSREDLDRAIALDPTSALFFNARAVYRLESGDVEGAEADFSVAIKLDASNVSALSNRAMARKAQRNFKGALEDLDRALSIDPKDVNALVNRAGVRRASGDGAGAMGDASRAIQLDPTHPGAYLNRGNAKFDLKDYQGTIEDWSRFVELAPGHAFAAQMRRDIEGLRKQLEGE